MNFQIILTQPNQGSTLLSEDKHRTVFSLSLTILFRPSVYDLRTERTYTLSYVESIFQLSMSTLLKFAMLRERLGWHCHHNMWCFLILIRGTDSGSSVTKE